MSTGPLVVFLGPSLSHAAAREILPGVICLPPAAMGDILGVLTSLRPRAIGLVDGTFLSNMSVFHKEILYAMDHGVWMLGASSMGALRAAECDDYGMIGVGGIYESLVSGALEDDDEVALTHAEAAEGFRPLSDALVTIRATIEAAAAAGLLDDVEAAALIEVQKSRWFPERRLSSVPGDASDLGIAEERCAALREFVRTQVVDPKRADAIALLERMAQLPDGPVPVDERPGTVMSGVFAAMLARDVAVETSDGLPVTFDRMRKYAALHDPEFDDLMSRARQEVVLANVSMWLAGPPTDEECAKARIRLSRRAGVDVADLDDWARDHDLNEGGLRAALTNEALVHRVETSWLGRTRMGEITAGYLHQARLAGAYPSLKSAAALQHAAAKGVTFTPHPTPQHLVLSMAALGTWRIPADFGDYVEDTEFGSVGELIDAMSTSVRAHHALFGIGLVDIAEDASLAIDDQEPMMSRGR